jgi:formylglycine-generating enzyme required for sulfatase activity
MVAATNSSNKDRPPVVAVSPCVVGPGVAAELGTAVTDSVVAALTELPHIQVIDRSLTEALVREQDLVLVSGASSTLPKRFGGLGSQQVIIPGLLKTSSDLLLSMRLLDVATGRVLNCSVHQRRVATELVSECGAWASALLTDRPGRDKANVEPNRLDAGVESMWRQVDTAEARVLLGSAVERAESVYRQYREAATGEAREEAERLAQMASVYLVDCVSLLQRAEHPPPGMVYVPPGDLVIDVPGSRPKRVWVAGFFIDRCEYTCAEYAKFLRATARAEPLGWSSPTEETANIPVVGVDWLDAEAAATWRGMQLPTYAQWLRASMGPEESTYPWGTVWRPECCVFARDPARPVLQPVGSRPAGASNYGMLDAVGSVCEWLDTWSGWEYWRDAPTRNPRGPKAGTRKLAAGGGYRTGPGGCTRRSVEALSPGTRRDDLGFRCVLALTSSADH